MGMSLGYAGGVLEREFFVVFIVVLGNLVV